MVGCLLPKQEAGVRLPLTRSRVRLGFFRADEVPSQTGPIIYISSLPMPFYVYTLLSLKDYKLYAGFTTNLRDRLSQHARGEVSSTANRRPLKLIHYEYFVNEADAKAREVFLKSGFGRGNMKKALQRTLQEYAHRSI